MTTRIDIANQALATLSTPPIASWDEDTRSARAVRRFWDQGRRFCLSQATWRFAARRCVLAIVQAQGDYKYVYRLPTDYLLPRGWYTSSGQLLAPHEFEWTQLGDTVHTDQPLLKLEYIADVAEVSLWPPAFVEMLVAWLAAKLSGPLTNRPVSEAELAQTVEQAFLHAISLAAILDPAHAPQPTTWERVRTCDEF